MNQPIRLIPVVAAATIALAACGQSHTQPTTSANNLTAWQSAVTCARQHGMPDIPDPIIGAGGRVSIPGGTPTPTPAVASACASQIRAIETFVPRESAPNMVALVHGANCIRAHGYPGWPDPNPQGVFHVKSAVAGTPERLGRALQACRSRFPGGWRLDITPSGQ